MVSKQPTPHSRRLCAAASILPPPFLHSRKSVASTSHTTSSVVSHSFFLERHIELIRPTQYGTRPITLKRFTNLDRSSRLFTQVRVTVTVTVSWHETPGPWPPMRRAARRAGDAARWHVTWPLLAVGSRASDFHWQHSAKFRFNLKCGRGVGRPRRRAQRPSTVQVRASPRRTILAAACYKQSARSY